MSSSNPSRSNPGGAVLDLSFSNPSRSTVDDKRLRKRLQNRANQRARSKSLLLITPSGLLPSPEINTDLQDFACKSRVDRKTRADHSRYIDGGLTRTRPSPVWADHRPMIPQMKRFLPAITCSPNAWPQGPSSLSKCLLRWNNYCI